MTELKLVDETEKKEIITENMLRKFFECPHQYYLAVHYGYTKAPRSVFAAQTMFFNNARRDLLKVRDPKVGRIFADQMRAGPQLNLAQDMTAEELRQYLAFKSPESFGGAVVGDWMRTCKRGYYAEGELVWSFRGQPHSSGEELRAAAENYYRFLLEHDAPRTGTLEKRVIFDFEGLRLEAKLPEIRKPGIVDDPKLWSFNTNVDKVWRGKIETSNLVTLRLLAFSALVTDPKSDFYRRHFDVPPDVAERLADNLLDRVITYRHMNGQTGVVTQTSRDQTDLDHFKRTLEYFLTHRATEEFPVEHNFCGWCPYNAIGMKSDPLCHERKSSVKPLVPAYYFKIRNRSVIVDSFDNTLILTAVVRKNDVVQTAVAKYKLSFVPTEEGMAATSEYRSPVRGHDFELLLLETAFEQLQQRADGTGKPVTHTIDFSSEFDAAGKDGVADFLKEHRYVHSVAADAQPSRRHYVGAIFTKQYVPQPKKKTRQART